MDSADAGADVEDGQAVDAARGEAVDEPAGRLVGTLLPKALQVTAHGSLAELVADAAGAPGADRRGLAIRRRRGHAPGVGLMPALPGA